jgi:AcrR family transcriptional regulator
MVKTDARVRYTRRVIKESFLKLLLEKPIKEIMVKEICGLAEINRATFYTHYRDPYDLLEQIENELFENLTRTVALAPDDIPSQIKEILKLIEKNDDICRILFSENGDKTFLRRIMDSSREMAMAGFKRQYPQVTRAQLDYVYEFIAGGSVAVVTQWVRSGMQETPSALGEVIKEVTGIWLQSFAGANP